MLSARCCPAALPLLLLALPALLLPAAISAQPVTIPVPNGGFEQVDEKTGTPAGWSPWTTPGTCAYTLATAHSGVACALVTDTDGQVSQGLRSPRVEIVSGRSYEARAWVQIARASSGFALYLEYWCGPERVRDVAVSLAQAPQWRELVVQAAAPPNATHATMLIYSSSANAGSACFDDVTLSALP